MLDAPNKDVRISAAVIISQAAKVEFTSDPENWDPDHMGAWVFETEASGEYAIVVDAKEWWEGVGSSESWPKCPMGLHGENVLP